MPRSNLKSEYSVRWEIANTSFFEGKVDMYKQNNICLKAQNTEIYNVLKIKSVFPR